MYSNNVCLQECIPANQLDDQAENETVNVAKKKRKQSGIIVASSNKLTIIKRHVTTWTRSIRLTSLKAIRLRRIESFVSWWSIFYSANNYSPIIPLSTIFSSFLRKVSKNNSIESIILFHQFLKNSSTTQNYQNSSHVPTTYSHNYSYH